MIESHVNTIWCHTPKAVRRGEPANRLFVVVCIAPVNDGSPNWQKSTWMHAWKCTLLPNGLIQHPAYDQALSPLDPQVFCVTSTNGSQPTAVFRPDSLYKLWSPK